LDSFKTNLEERLSTEKVKLLKDLTSYLTQDFHVEPNGSMNNNLNMLRILNGILEKLDPLSLFASSKLDLMLDRALDRIQRYVVRVLETEEKDQGKVRKEALTALQRLAITRGSLSNVLTLVKSMNEEESFDMVSSKQFLQQLTYFAFCD
jgi:hypothetical protein